MSLGHIVDQVRESHIFFFFKPNSYSLSLLPVLVSFLEADKPTHKAGVWVLCVLIATCPTQHTATPTAEVVRRVFAGAVFQQWCGICARKTTLSL